MTTRSPSDDTATVNEDSGSNAINVLGNDTDVDGGPKSVATVSEPTNGTAAITGSGVSYTPDPDYCNAPPGTETDDFTYTLAPGGATATVAVTVDCVDDTPPPSDGTPPPADGAPPPADGAPPGGGGAPPGRRLRAPGRRAPAPGRRAPAPGRRAPGPPVVGETVNVSVISGVIGLKCEGDSGVPAPRGRGADPGRLPHRRSQRPRAADLLNGDRGRHADGGVLGGESSSVKQKVGSKPFTVLELVGPNANPSAAAARRDQATVARRRNRKLWGKGSGRFRSKGRHGAGSTRGTTWLVADIGDTTLCKVKNGKVRFRDFFLGKTVTVRAGEKYVAKRRKR